MADLTRNRIVWILGTSMLAAISLGQISWPRLVSPPESPYRLTVVEPREGQTLPAGAVRVAVTLALRGQEGGAPRNPTATPVPTPRVEVFLDKESRGTVDGQGVLVIEGVQPGNHTLLVTASDRNGPVVDRKEIHFSVLPPSVD
jgi:hypothetical protein